MGMFLSGGQDTFFGSFGDDLEFVSVDFTLGSLVWRVPRSVSSTFGYVSDSVKCESSPGV